MKSLKYILLEKLIINKDSVQSKIKKKYDNIVDIDRYVVRPELEEYGYIYGSDYDTNIGEGFNNKTYYTFDILDDDKFDKEKMEWLANTVEEILLDYDMDYELGKVDIENQHIVFKIKGR